MYLWLKVKLIQSLFSTAASEIGCVKAVNIDIDHKYKIKPLYALILTPTRELAMQVKKQLVDVAKYTGK